MTDRDVGRLFHGLENFQSLLGQVNSPVVFASLGESQSQHGPYVGVTRKQLDRFLTVEDQVVVIIQLLIRKCHTFVNVGSNFTGGETIHKRRSQFNDLFRLVGSRDGLPGSECRIEKADAPKSVQCQIDALFILRYRLKANELAGSHGHHGGVVDPVPPTSGTEVESEETRVAEGRLFHLTPHFQIHAR